MCAGFGAASSRWRERLGVPDIAPPPHQLGLGPGAGCLPPGFGSALTLRLVPRGLLPPSQSGSRPCAGVYSEPGLA